MSSMGDIIHTLPALTDACNAIPNLQFDWVVEEAFTEIPLWHKNVTRVIPIALRRWRKYPWQAIKNGEIKKFYQQLRSQHYDLIIDAQSSIKSAITTRLALGKRCGLDKKSAREMPASLAYQQTYFIDRKQHAIQRIRQLFSQVLNYSLPNNLADYAIDQTKLAPVTLNLPQRYVVFIHGTNWASKCWMEENWLSLLKEVTNAGFHVLLPWGNTEEKARAMRLAENNPMTHILPALTLAEIATILANAKATVSVDTGLSHLTAALNTPAITLYGPTHPELIGTIGKSQIHLCDNTADNSYRDRNGKNIAISPQYVWQELKKLLALS